MKTTFIASFFLAILIFAPELNAQDHNHEEHLGKLLTHYFEIKNGLVEDDFESAKSALELFSKEVHSNSQMTNHPEHSDMHSAHHSGMVASVNKASEASGIDVFRASFDEITNELLKAIENHGYTDGTLYVQFCPMQNDGKGAKWISREEQILNPYYGAKMIKCGNVVSKID